MKSNTITIDKYLAAIIVLVCLNAGYLLGGCVGRQLEKEKILRQEAQP